MPNTVNLSPKSDDLNINDDEVIYVITRTGKKELLDTNKIVKRLQQLINRAPKIQHVNPYDLMLKVTPGLKSYITTSEIDEYTADAAASLSLSNPYYMKLASRIAVDNHQKNTGRSFTDKMRKLYLYNNHKNEHTPLVSEEFYKYVEEHQDILEDTIDYTRDFLIDYFGFRTFEAMYSMKIEDKIIDRPQDLYMRTAVALHMNVNSDTTVDLANIVEHYNYLSTKSLTQASPTYFNAGTNTPQYASCFLEEMSDSINGIYKCKADSAKISKHSGGIGVHVHGVRSNGAPIRGKGKSKGLVPWLRGLNTDMEAVDQGGRRPGAAAVYLMPHHPDIIAFLSLKNKDGTDKNRARELFYSLWTPDIFMERVKTGAMWSLFDPHETVDLSNYYDEKNQTAYTNKYLELEEKKLYKKQIPARDVWEKHIESNQDNGGPYLCFSDNANRMNMQKNIGVIKSSNLCAEVYLYSNENEIATCNLCSLSLSSCVFDSYTKEELEMSDDKRELDHEFPINPYFDFDKLQKLTEISVININNIIDKTMYPVKETKRSNMRHRPIGIGVQGLADAYIKMRYPFDSEPARQLNKKIFETIYYAALAKSSKICRVAYTNYTKECKDKGEVFVETYVQENYKKHLVRFTDPKTIPKTIGAYPSMLWNGGAPISKGTFHWELSGLESKDLSGMYDWESLRDHIKTYGVRNSVLVALMPTASTSQFLGNNECIEPYTTNIYKRKTLAGEFIVINKYLIHDMFRLGIWNNNIKEYLLALNGSIQAIDGIPQDLKDLYKTAYELNPEEIIQQAIDRQPFVDQGQSLNWYIEDLTNKLYTKLAFKAWRGKLKTAKYYLHSRSAVDAQKFTIDPTKQKEMAEKLELEKNKRDTKFLEPKEEVCLVCSS